jgi:hypothetical protein
MKPNFKSVFKSENWIIYNVIESRDGKRFRIDAKTRFWVSDGENFFSNWGTADYLNRLCLENYGKKVNQMSVFKWY